MSHPQDFLTRLHARARFLSERMRDAAATESDSRDDARLDDWRLAAAGGDPVRFERRLRWSGWDPARAGAALLDASTDPASPPPAWAALVDAWLRSFEAGGSATERSATTPFAELWTPLCQLACAQLIERVSARAWARLSEQARAQLCAALLRRLDTLGQRCVYVAYRGGPVGMQAFIERARAGGLRALLDEYPVLARFAATAALLWVEANAELIERLDADWTTLERSFGGPFDGVVSIDAQLSDPHAGGRSVAIVRFDTDTRVVYKPRGLAIDVAYNELVAELTTRGDLLELRTLITIDRETHGWVEFAEAAPCPDLDAARRLYTRAGMLVCLVYALGGLDCHHENLIACGEQFVFIDLEAILQPPAKPLGAHRENAEQLAARRFSDSVLRGGMLPCWEVLSVGDEPVDQSGLGGGRSQRGLAPRLRWRSIGADDVVLELHVPADGERMSPNVPLLDGRALHPRDFVEDIVAGFASMYRAVSSHPLPRALARFDHLALRYLLRPTRVYHLLLRDALRPPLLRDGAAFSIGIEPLARALSKLDERPSAWALLDAELAALERLDLPLFVARADARSIFAPDGQEAAEVLPERPREHLAARLRSLSAQDMAEQIMIIRCSLHDGAGEATCDCGGHTKAAAIEPATLTSEVLIDEARALADEIGARVIQADDGSVAWIGAAFMRESRRFQLRPLDYSLDRGSAGVALFLATLASLERERGQDAAAAERHAALAVAALAPLRRVCSDPLALSSLAARIGLGACTGLGGLIYALTRCAVLVDPHLLDDARTLAREITPELIERDHELDVVSGSAGAILGLLALHAATGEPEPLERANLCAAHLLANRSLSDSGHLVWRPRGCPAQTGLSHGAAGFALALTRLHAHTGDDRQLAAAREAIAFERSAFVAEADNWLDLRPGASEPCAMSWCNGAPGIGLARLDLLGLPGLRDDAELLDEIAIAIRTTSEAPLAAIDTPCCGNLGRIELLICAGAQRQAQQLAAQVIARARAEGSYRVLRDAPAGMFAPGFMSGTAGIGHQLLRLAAPERVASVLLWQPVG